MSDTFSIAPVLPAEITDEPVEGVEVAPAIARENTTTSDPIHVGTCVIA